MSFTEAISSVFRNYANFRGRARRSEYWMFYLFKILVYVSCLVITVILLSSSDEALEWAAIIYVSLGIFTLATIIPELAVACRRLHDIGHSGAYLFLLLLPVIGQILILVWTFQDGQPWTNQYGPDPKGRNQSPYGTPYAASGSGTPYTAADSRTPYSTASSEVPYTSARRDTAKRAKKNCMYCGASIDADAVFCTACGRDLRPTARPDMRSGAAAAERAESRKIICANCGKAVDQGSSVCPFCGKSPSFRTEERRSAESASRVKSRGFSVPTDLD